MRWFNSIQTIALAACIARSLAGQGCLLTSGPVLTHRLQHFVATEERRLSALVRLGHENGLCFGIETVTDNFNEKITLRLSHTDAQNAINAVLGSSREYEISVLHNVILIRDKRVRPPEYLALRLPGFRIPRSTLVWANLNLWMSVEMRLDPNRKGFAGDSPPGDAQTRSAHSILLGKGFAASSAELSETRRARHGWSVARSCPQSRRRLQTACGLWSSTGIHLDASPISASLRSAVRSRHTV
jgi:hypothetical protein